MNDSIHSSLDKAKQEQALSIPAKRLIEKLQQLKNRKETSARRWFWELLQNASDYNESVSVRLVVEQGKVCFMHDGLPFSIKDVLNLVQPDSNKDEETTHKGNIGKFGTGLVSTHILSSVIRAEGICLDEGRHYKFNVSIDRSSFLTKEKLIDDIQDTMDELSNSFVDAVETSGFHTRFTYDLTRTLPTLPSVNADDINLEYIYEMLPYTLCFMPKVQSVEIEDCRHGKSVFSISRKSVTDDAIVFDIERDGTKENPCFAYFHHNNVATAICIEDSAIKPFPCGMARFFCGLPLVGTEEVGMPFILNSLCFEPTTEREGIELEPGSNEQNRKMMNESVVLYTKMLDYVEKKQLRNAYLLTNIRRKYNGTQASNQQFYNQWLAQYKKQILCHALVRNVQGGIISVSEVRLPFNDSKEDEKLYSFAKFTSADVLPKEEDYAGWFEAIDFSLFTDQKYTVKDLTAAIEKKENVFAFGRNVQEVKEWLRDCLPYFKESNPYVFQEKRLLPNQCGEFCRNNSLYLDKELPSELKAIYNQLYEGENIEKVLLDQSFNDLEVLSRVYSTEMLAKKIDEAIAEKYKNNNSDIMPIIKSVNELYTWIASSELSKEKLADWFRWYYPKRASLIVDMLTENQREQAITIAKSGKMDALAKLASSDLTDDEISLLIANIKNLPSVLAHINDNVDDRSHANSETGDWGEEIVYKNLLLKYPKTQGYKVHWESRDNGEPCYDFKVTKEDTVVCYVDAKTTTRGMANADSIPYFMRKSQWIFLDSLNEETPYFIARVFKGDRGEIRYLRIMKY